MKARYIVGAVIILLAAATSVYLLSQSQIQYTTINSARMTGKKVQIKGQWVEQESASYDPTSNTFHFILEDEHGSRIPVVYSGSKPNNMEMAESIVVRGRIENNTFYATDILTKCPSKYEGSSSLSPQSQ